MSKTVEIIIIFSTIFIVFICGLFVGAAIGYKKQISNKEHQQLIQECQAKLPRDKFCKLIAVEEE